MAAKLAASEPNEKNFPFMSNLRMSLKLIFMIIQDDLGGHYGKRFDVGNIKILELDNITITKM